MKKKNTEERKGRSTSKTRSGSRPSFCWLQKLLVFCFCYTGKLFPLCNVNYAQVLFIFCLLKAEVEARLKDRETVLAGKIGKLQTR